MLQRSLTRRAQGGTTREALGAGLILVPTEEVLLQLLALDAEGTPESHGFDTVFNGGTVLAFEGRTETGFFDLPGHHLLGATWSSRNFVSTDQDPRILLNLLPGITIPAERVSNSWSVYYNFDQYLWQPEGDSERGIGIFGRLGFADEDASPIEWFASLGVGGKGALPGRRHDSFGLGYFVVGASDGFPGLADLDHGQGFEVYYDIAVTPWLHLTPDLQVIDPALRRLDTAVVLGLRSKIEF
jgi:porin